MSGAPPYPSLFDSLGEAVGREFQERRDSVPAALLYAPDAAEQLAACLSAELAGRRALLVGDQRTRAAAGEPVQRALQQRGWSCRWQLLEGPGGGAPVCDPQSCEQVRAALPQADACVAVGSGVVNDVTKWAASEAGISYSVVATAASMNGYAASNVAPSLDGVKSLVRARAPRWIAAIPHVIEAAPPELTASGLGDLLARSVSTADWVMNHLVFGEPFFESLAAIAAACEPGYLAQPEALMRREPGAIRALLQALVYSGCAMTLHGSSLPASGGEHLISHTLDMLGHVDGTSHDLHGRQVGVATIFAAALYRRMLSAQELAPTAACAPLDSAVWKGLSGAVGLEHARKVQASERARAWLAAPGAWQKLRTALSPLVPEPGQLREQLRRAGAAYRLQDIGCSPTRFVQAVLHCGAMRGRFTSIDLGWVTGALPGAAHELVTAWLE
jgi:glycerol-1-phosphate dehydrogenase [NAD(P)+]